MKTCNKCKITKELSEFHKHKRHSDGLSTHCKECVNKNIYSKRKTKDGLIARMYSTQKTHSKSRGHNSPKYTQHQLKEWLFSQHLFHELYDNWVFSNFDMKEKPSIDRIDNYKPYSFDNIQLMTWKENKQKGHDDQRSGILINTSKPQKSVMQYTRDGTFIKEFVSIMEVEREFGIFRAGVSACCLGKKSNSHAGGFVWRFKA